MIKKIITGILILSFICVMPTQVLCAQAEQVIKNDATGIPDKGLYQAILMLYTRIEMKHLRRPRQKV